ncbi:MAG TPA: sigma factor-like helix-turn-helix DNA-binding protein [Verrucomicrobiae bacterium]|jgi:hypothetical protein|nr:sigma factor-like helix-turn-helix DNA-binding protein [Verrucomicrobiae bacterium]
MPDHATEPWEKHPEQIADGSLEAGLICLRAWVKPHQTMTHRDIAKVCGVSRGTIFNIEHTAVKKLRHAMRKQLRQTYGEFFHPGNTHESV